MKIILIGAVLVALVLLGSFSAGMVAHDALSTRAGTGVSVAGAVLGGVLVFKFLSGIAVDIFTASVDLFHQTRV